MSKARNILFIMFDQLRFDYLSCAGHPHLHTPNIDWLASKSVRFDRAYVQSPVCGASRMSFYTGRYISSHGSTWNGIPLRVGEWTMGDHLREAGMDSLLVGKTHMEADADGMERLGLAPDSIIGARLAECGFDVLVRDDGLWGTGPDGNYDDKDSPYNAYLRQQGYEAENPWHDYANAGIDDDGNIASGWVYANAGKPANIREEDSETPWLTREMISFLRRRAPARAPMDVPSQLHQAALALYRAGAYHDMYGPNSFIPVTRHEDELADPHPVYAAFSNNVIGTAFKQDAVRESALAPIWG